MKYRNTRTLQKEFIKSICFCLAITFLSCSESVESQSKLPSELITIPDGIEVQHSKDTVYAELNLEDPSKRGKYKWHFATSVKSLHEDLRIIEFGEFHFANGKWKQKTIYDRPFNNSEFAKWYGCPEGKLLKGKTVTDKNNWVKGDLLDGKEEVQLWYYIGIDDKGKKFKGTAEIVSINKLKK